MFVDLVHYLSRCKFLYLFPQFLRKKKIVLWISCTLKRSRCILQCIYLCFVYIHSWNIQVFNETCMDDNVAVWCVTKEKLCMDCCCIVFSCFQKKLKNEPVRKLKSNIAVTFNFPITTLSLSCRVLLFKMNRNFIERNAGWVGHAF